MIAIAAMLLDWMESPMRNRAFSPEAQRSKRSSGEPRDHDTSPSVSVDREYEERMAALMETAKEASRPGWDGHGAAAVSSATIAQAFSFLDILPITGPRPEISAHPDGEVAFEWYVGPGRILTVSVNGAGRLSYAALFGYARHFGTEVLLDSLPEEVARALQRLYSDSSGRRPAA